MVSPSIDRSRVDQLLAQQFGKAARHLTQLNTGLIGRAFSFEIDRAPYIIKFVDHQHAGSIQKEVMVQELARGSTIPIPPYIHTGTMDEFHFAIAPFISGKLLADLDFAEYSPLVPAIIENIDAIGQIDVSTTTGYGDFNGSGSGRFNSWQDCLLDVANETPPGTFYSNWHHLFEDSFLDRAYFDEVYQAMTDLLPYTPPDRHLIHSDYGFTNVIAENGRIVGVLDWANALIGDSLYDVAWMDFYTPQYEFKERFRDYYASQGRSIDHYDERIVCYQCHINLDNQRWLGVSNNPETYGWHRARVMETLGRGPAAGPPLNY